MDAPYSYQLEAGGGTGSYLWSIESGQNHTWLSIDPVSGLISGTPDASALGPVQVTVRVAETTVTGNTADQTFTFNVIQAIFYESFDNGPGDFFEPFDCDWAWGTPSVTGPASCYGGSSGCWGTGGRSAPPPRTAPAAS